jgi:hypothetical protein
MADLTSRNITQNFISKLYVNVNARNDDIIKITTRKFSSSGDTFELDTRAILPSVIQTEKSINELNPEISNTYPFKVVVPVDEAGKTTIYSPTIDYEVTASQSYYVPVYFERYDPDIIREIDKEFRELELVEEDLD